MTAQALITACENAQSNYYRLLGKDRRAARIMLRIPGRWPKSGEHKRLGGRAGGPLGRCVAEDADKNGNPVIMVDFLAQDILDYLLAKRIQS